MFIYTWAHHKGEFYSTWQYRQQNTAKNARGSRPVICSSFLFFLHNRIKTRCARKRSSPHAAAFPGERDGADGLVDRKGVTLRPVSRDAVIRSHRSAPVLNTYCRRECTRQRCGTTRMCAKCQQRKVLRACIKCNYLRSFLVEFGWWFPPFLPRGLVNTWQQKQNSPVAWIRPITSVCTAGDKVCSSFM